MRLDYHEKKGGRESAERKPVQKNRPRKEPVGLFALMSVFVLVSTFGVGVLTGWFFFKGPKNPPAAVVAQAVQKVEPAPPPGQPGQAGPDAPLTFYQTLPAGGKGVIGSGLNLTLPQPPPAPTASTVVRPAPVNAPATAKPPAEKQANPENKEKQDKQERQETPDKQEKRETQEQQEKQEKQEKKEKQEKQEKRQQQESQEKQEVPARFLVQIASYRDKQEAGEAQAKLAAKGVAAYLVESRLPDKSVWYRLRVGRNLTKAEAEQIAKKSGKGVVLSQ